MLSVQNVTLLTIEALGVVCLSIAVHFHRLV